MKKKSTTLLLNSLLVTTALMCVSCSRNSSPLPIAFEEPTLHSETTNVEAEKTGRILYLMQIGETARSIEEYNKYRKEGHSHNLELVQQMGMVILERGYHSYSPEVQLMTVFGAGVVGNPRILHILDAASESDDPQVQLTALGYLANLHNDAADAMLARGMTSPYLLIRLETAYYLATMKYPSAVGQIESLMQRLPQKSTASSPNSLPSSETLNPWPLCGKCSPPETEPCASTPSSAPPTTTETTFSLKSGASPPTSMSPSKKPARPPSGSSKTNPLSPN